MTGVGASVRALRTWAAFLAVAGGLVLGIVGHPLLSDRVYSQADILLGEYPWAAHRPAGFTAPGNSLLADIPMLMYPGLAFARDRVIGGQLPVWNPHLFGGQPFIGATQTAVFSPFTAIAYVVPLPDALTWIYMARLLVGGAGMFAFLGALGIGTAGRFFGALAWMLTPFTIVWLSHPLSEVSAWLPWLVLTTRSTCLRGSARDVAALAAVTSLSLFAGHPETTLKALLFCGALALAFACAPATEGDRAATRTSHPARALTRAMAGVVLGLLLAAVQVLPSIEYLAHSEALAARQVAGPNIYVVPPETLVTAVVPDFLGHPVSRTYLPMENRYGLASNYAEQQTYAGIAVWLVACVGAWHRRRVPVERTVAGLGVLAGLIMYGTPGISQLVSAMPVLDVVVLSRFGIVVAFGAAWLAAVGFDAMVDRPRIVSAMPALVAGSAMAALVVASLMFFMRPLTEQGLLPRTLAWVGFAALLGLVSTGAMVLRRRERLSAAAFAGTLVLVLIADLAVFAWGFHPAIDRALVFPDLPEIRRVQDDKGLYRIAGWRHAMIPNTATVYGLSDYRGYDGIAPRAWGSMLDAVLPRDRGQFREFRDPAALRLLRLLNVRYVFGEPGVSLAEAGLVRVDAGPAPLWRDDQAFPRAFLADRFEVVRTQTDLEDRLRDPGVDLRRTVLLERRPTAAESRDAGQWPAAEVETASVRHYRDAFVEVHTQADAPRILVLADNFFPGWTVSVDGQPAPLLQADGGLRGVYLDAGRHSVQFVYEPMSLRLGVLISLLAAAGVVVLLAGRATRRR